MSPGLVLGHDDDWSDAVLALARDPTLRARFGAEGRTRVERDYSVQRWGPTLATILRG